MYWPTKKLGEVAEVIMGQSPPSSSYNERGEGLPFFQGKAEFGEIYPTPIKYCLSPSRIAEKNDILISVRAPVGNINIAREKSCIGRGLGALRAKKNILSQMFLFYFMKKNENNWSRLSTGSTFSAIKGSSLKNFEIPTPPLNTQKQIVERLDKIAEAQKLNDDLIQKSDELFQSLLHQELNPVGKDWKVKKIREVCDELFAGGDVPRNNFSKIKTEKYPVPIFANGVGGKDLYGYTNIKKVIKPSITISARGTIGHPAMRTEAFYPIVRLIVLIPNSKIVDLYFLYYATRNFNFFNTGTSIPQLTIPMIERIKIPIPPLKIQKQIVAKLSAVQKYKSRLLEQKSKLKELFESALHNAFRSSLR